MSVLETVRKRPAVATSVSLVVIVVAIICVFRQLAGGRSNGLPTRSFYSTDDGATYFTDDANLVPPFDRDGKRALKAEVFVCSGGKPFVGYLGRYIASPQQPASEITGGAPLPHRPTYQVKLPLTGNHGWTDRASGAADILCSPHCPDGSKEIPNAVFP